MTSQHDKAIRWQPRFSVRTLVVVITLVCCYLGCLHATIHYGVPDVVAACAQAMQNDDVAAWHRRVLPVTAEVPLPFIVVIDPNGSPPQAHCWFFGDVGKLQEEPER